MSGHCDNPDCEHQAPTNEYNRVDYAEKMEDLIFNYDKDFYPDDEELPDPQVDPIIPGANKDSTYAINTERCLAKDARVLSAK